MSDITTTAITTTASLTTPAPAAGSMPRLPDRLQALMDNAALQIEAGDAVAAFRLLTPPLSALWTEARALGMADEVLQLARDHRLHALVRQDPFTRRAAEKPRGYAGDAVMLDYIYGTALPEVISDIGRNVFACTTRSGMGLSVMYRRVLLRSLIDDVIATVAGGRILSVASGHCRELIGSGVQSPCFDGEFVALDQDAESCELVAREQQAHHVRVINRGVRDLMSGAAGELGRFDLVYSAGLYDYLPDALARRLTQRLLALVAPGGRLLIANFMPGGSGRGYQELFMDWTLIVRDAAEMDALARAAGAEQVHTFVDPHRNVVYAELQAPAGR